MAKADLARTGSTIRCAIYTRKSSDEGLEQEFNSLDAQREACEAYIVSQLHAGWIALSDMYDDGGLSGGTMERPALNVRQLSDLRPGPLQNLGALAPRQDCGARGRIVFDQSRDLFIIYADRKLLTPATIARLETQFLLPTERTEIHSDLHYNSKETPKLPGV